MLNRNEIIAAIEQQIHASGSGAGGFAVMALRIRGLREFAVRFGSDRGEQAEAGVRLLVRDSLRPQDVAFQSGDESFVVVLPGLGSRSHVLLAVTRLLAGFEQPRSVARDTPPWQAWLAMGIALHPEDGIDAEALWRNAQLAMDSARQRGDAYAFHNARTLPLEIDYQDLRESIESNRLVTYFQPLWDLARGRVAGVESLARWTSRILGPVRPDDFVTFAEQNDLIAALTRWSIHSTLRYASALHNASDCLLAINLSPRALSNGGLTEQLLDALNIWGIAPTSIIVEVTETALARDLDSTVRTLHRLREHGIRVAIDDFGTGYASITYLARFPASELKIDKSLVVPMGSDPRMAKLVESIIKFAHNLGLITTAEGIEDATTQRLLTEMGCDLGQGFQLGKPEPAADFVAKHGASPTEPGAG